MTSPTIPPEAILPPSQAGIAQAARLLSEGKLVVLPTETVYGIGVNLAVPEARDAARRLRALLTGDGGMPNWVLHVGASGDILGWMSGATPLARRLVSKALPGPVAFQIRLSEEDLRAARARLGEASDEAIVEGYLTMRCPDLPVTQQVLSQVAAPMAIVGAGTRVQPGVFELDELPEVLRTEIPGMLDGGPTRYRRSSTLVRIDGENYRVIRPGVIDSRIIDRFADLTILFLCSGNTCRSPMAAGIAARILADRLRIEPSELPLRHIVVQSAGLHATRGMRATIEAVEAGRVHNADLSTHFSQPATPELLRRADVIYTMTEEHLEEVLELLPGVGKKAMRLDPEADISDPIGMGLPAYEHVAEHLTDVLRIRLAGLTV